MGEVRDEVRARTDIVDLIGEFVDLKKVGNTIKGLCPFHQEKTPSFTVNPDKQTFHCFGCGTGGDAFTFVMKRQNIEFPAALEILAKRAGVEMSRNGGAYGRIHQMNAAAAEFYRVQLQQTPRILAYLKKTRGLTDESIERFGLGYASNKSLWRHLKGQGFSEKEIVDAGLARKKDTLMDYFWMRIIFPITSGSSVKGFGGRALDDNDLKYLNSPGTTTFQKKDILYGLKPSALKEKGFAYVTEGYLDVIMAHQHGHDNTVAPLGTALTLDQVKLVRKSCQRIYLVFDGDDAGKGAALKASQMLFREKMTGGVITLPEGEDMDSFQKKGGNLQELHRQAVPFSVFLSRERPFLRRRILDHLLFRSPLEASEFLAYESSPDERRMTAEMEARRSIGKFFPKSSVIVRKDGVEVRLRDNSLALFSSGGFKFMRDVEGDHKQQASLMLKNYLALKRKYAESVKKDAAVAGEGK